MSVSSAKAKLDAQGGDPVTGYISKTDVQESYDELVDGTTFTGTTTIAALTLAGVTVGSGSGSPEGTVAAPVGSMWTDKAVTTGASLWVKESGTGNTGWKVVYGDTYWRGISTWDAAGTVTGLALDATNSAPMSGVAGGIYLRRSGDTVWCRIHNLTTSGSTTGNIYAAGWNLDGWKMVNAYAVRPIALFSGDVAAVGTSYSFGYFQYYNAPSNPFNWQYSETSWQTPDAWPTSLPGSAATL